MKLRTSPSLLGRTFPGGIYKANITGRKVGTSQAGNATMSIEFTLTSNGPDPKIETKGRKLFDTLVFAENTLWKANDLYHGITGKDLPDKEFSADEFFAFIWNTIQNKPVIIEVVEGSYQGNTRMEIKKVSAQAV